MSDSLRPHGLSPTRLLCPWDSPGKNTGVGGHALLQGIFPNQGSNLGLPREQPPGNNCLSPLATGAPSQLCSSLSLASLLELEPHCPRLEAALPCTPVGFLSICVLVPWDRCLKSLFQVLLLRKPSLRCGVPSTQELSGRKKGTICLAPHWVQQWGRGAGGRGTGFLASLLQPLDFLFFKKKFLFGCIGS